MIEIAWSDLENGEYAATPAALTIGVFDGLHRGHQSLLDAIHTENGTMPVVVTFQRHPAEILATGAFPGFIMSLSQKRNALMEAGVAVVVGIDFSLEFSRMSGREFFESLVGAFLLRRVALGHDFRCGHRMSMDGREARKLLEASDVAVTLLDPLEDDGQIISSTRIRSLIRGGRLETAQHLLGRPYSLDVSGETVERDANELYITLDEHDLLPESRQILPPVGEYPALLVCEEFTAHTTLTIGRNSIRLPLAPESRIRYIVLQDNRVS